MHIFCDFCLCVLLSKHKVLYRISNIFSRQIIRDLLNYSCRSESKPWGLENKNLYIVISWSDLRGFCVILYIYFDFLTLRVMVEARGALRNLKYFFSTNNLRLVEKFLQIGTSLYCSKIKTSKSQFKATYSLISCHFHTHCNSEPWM